MRFQIVAFQCNLLPLERYKKMVSVSHENYLAKKRIDLEGSYGETLIMVKKEIRAWQKVHPGLFAMPVNWDYSIPYGLLYSFDVPEDVLRFVERVKALRNE